MKNIYQSVIWQLYKPRSGGARLIDIFSIYKFPPQNLTALTSSMRLRLASTSCLTTLHTIVSVHGMFRWQPSSSISILKVIVAWRVVIHSEFPPLPGSVLQLLTTVLNTYGVSDLVISNRLWIVCKEFFRYFLTVKNPGGKQLFTRHLWSPVSHGWWIEPGQLTWKYYTT